MSAEKLVVIGQGYVGLPLAMRAVEAGFDVVGLDVDADRVKRLASGESFVEDIPTDRLRPRAGQWPLPAQHGVHRRRRVRRLRDHRADPAARRHARPELRRAGRRRLGPYVRPGCHGDPGVDHLPGHHRGAAAPAAGVRPAACAARGDFHLGYSPERIDPGNPTWRLENTPKVVSGIDAASLARVDGFYRLARGAHRAGGLHPQVAELTKLIENTFRHVNIALINELTMLSHQLDIDVWQAIDAASTKPFGFMPFRPGPGVGGHCLPIDPCYLSWQVKRTPRAAASGSSSWPTTSTTRCPSTSRSGSWQG